MDQQNNDFQTSLLSNFKNKLNNQKETELQPLNAFSKNIKPKSTYDPFQYPPGYFFFSRKN